MTDYSYDLEKEQQEQQDEMLQEEEEEKKEKNPLLLLLLLLLLIGGVIAVGYIFDSKLNAPVIEDEPTPVAPKEPEIIDEEPIPGKKGVYEYKNTVLNQSEDITVILCAGVYSNNPNTDIKNADCIVLVVANDKKRTLQPIQISRDTMCNYNILDSMGKISNSQYGRIALAHNYGDNDLENLMNLRDAVSDLMCNIDIDYYVSSDITAAGKYATSIGGIKLKMLTDLTYLDPKYKKGSTLTITGDKLNNYLIGNTSKEKTSVIETRQADFLKKLYKQFLNGSRSNKDYMSKVVDTIPNLYCLSSNEIVGIANNYLKYKVLPMVNITGTTKNSNEFYPNATELEKLCIKYFYTK